MAKLFTISSVLFGLFTIACAPTSEGSDVIPPVVVPTTPEVVAIDICSAAVAVSSPKARNCEPGAVVPAICQGAMDGSWGTRTCNVDGSGYDGAVCPEGYRNIAASTTRLLVARKLLVNDPGFFPLLYMRESSDFIFAETLVSLFPRASKPESIRAGLQYLWANELPGLKNVLLVGVPQMGTTENAKEFISNVDFPLYYVDVPPASAHDETETQAVLASRWAYGYLRGELPVQVGSRLWSPGSYRPDVHVGLIPARGDIVCDFDDAGMVIGESCKTGLQRYVDSIRAFETRIDGQFVVSQFDGFACHGQDWDLEDNDLFDGVTRNVRYHACEGGEKGDIGPMATADGADVAIVQWHGAPDGINDGAAYTLNAATEFNGIGVGESCSTGSPDQQPVSLGESLLMKENGMAAYVGFGRVANSSSIADPFERAFVAGRYTLGEAVDGYVEDILAGLAGRVQIHDLVGLMLYGDPSMPIAPVPAKAVRTLASRVNADGSVDACVVATGRVHDGVALAVGDTEVGSATINEYGGSTVAVNIPSEASAPRNVIRMVECDPTVETCQVASLDPEPVATLDCGEVVAVGDFAYTLEMEASVDVVGSGLSLKADVVTSNCVDGVSSACYLDSYSMMLETQEVGRMDIDELRAGTNYLDVDFSELDYAADEFFRGIRVQATNLVGNVIAECWVPMTQNRAEEMRLL